MGAALFVPPGSGLAAGPTALSYGVVGALAAVFFAVVLAWKLPARSVRQLALLAILLSALMAVFIGYRVWGQRAARLARGEPMIAEAQGLNRLPMP
jgi:uncharacterized membrane protein